jgi:hypothetical protein
MHTDKPLYDPKLVEHWSKRYRDFEIDEMIRRRRKARSLTRARPRSKVLDRNRDKFA